MNFLSIFDVIGPNMIGPSSSHTAGAVSIALLARKMFPEEVKKVTFTLYGSFAKTYHGHGTDRALLGGILGFSTDDERIRDAFAIATERGVEYEYIIDDVEFTGEYSTLIVSQTDKPGVVAHITQCLSEENVNIAFMRLFREDKGANAFTVVESDEMIPPSVLDKIKAHEHVSDLMLIQM